MVIEACSVHCREVVKEDPYVVAALEYLLNESKETI